MSSRGLRIALLGYGKMGRTVEEIARERGYTVVARVETSHPFAMAKDRIACADVAMEFSVPSLAVDHISQCVSLGVPVVCGTTGWYDRLEEVKALVTSRQGAAVFVAANYSLGVAITRHLCVELGEFRKLHPEYRVSIREVHHAAKLDAPSGTALVLADAFIDGSANGYHSWCNGSEAKPGVLPIASERYGDVPGTHEVVLESAHDTIVLRHEAKGRRMFACGAMDAAEYLVGRQGFYGMETLLQLGKEA